MTINEIIRKVRKLVADYYDKHGVEPNAIIMCEAYFNILSVHYNLYVNHDVEELDIHNCRFMGMKVIPVKKGEMEVFELL